MSVPILRQDDVLIASLQVAQTDVDLADLRDRLAKQVGEMRIRGVVIDVTSMDVMDSFATRMLRAIAYTAKLRGAEAVVVGIQPEVALAMVQLGLELGEVATALDLDEGLAILRAPGSRGDGA